MNHSPKLDCTIIGGGLAGLTLGVQLAKKGIAVALFEKETYPFHKVCGEYISMESWDFIESCNIPLSQLNLPKISKLKVSSPDGNFLTHQLGLGGFGISRYKLDNMLAEECKNMGVNIYQNTKVNSIEFENEEFIIETSVGNFKSKIVIGSHGKRSNIDIKLKRNFITKAQPASRNYIGVKYHISLPFPNDTIELHNFENGYCGISKVDGDRLCLCYLTTAQNLQKYGSIKQMEQNILMKNPFLKDYFSNAHFLYSEPLSISQINFSSKSCIENHIIMCGDSAGLIAPLCGNGMSIAMHSSKILSDLIPLFIKSEISRDEMEEKYQKQWNSQFKTRLTVGRLIQYSFGKAFLTNLVINILKPFPRIINGLVSLTHGKPF